MVSFALDTVKFLLIYRHLQNTYWFKRGASPLLVPRSIGLRIAPSVETSNADTTPIQRQISCNNQNDKKSRVNTNIYSI